MKLQFPMKILTCQNEGEKGDGSCAMWRREDRRRRSQHGIGKSIEADHAKDSRFTTRRRTRPVGS